MRSLYKKLLIGAIFAFAMSYLEATVVVYLRELYYPDGFQFPLIPLPNFILYTEIGREFATIIMLWAVAYLTATNARTTFAYFCLNFGIWDIGYYLWLKIFLNWPATLLDWDVLFLIPLPWIGPILAPIIVSIALIFAALCILKYNNLQLNRIDWFFEIFAGFLIIISFLFQLDRLNRFESPGNYPWWLFTIALASGLAVFIRRLRRAHKEFFHSSDDN
jgi:hypothetical protein